MQNALCIAPYSGGAAFFLLGTALNNTFNKLLSFRVGFVAGKDFVNLLLIVVEVCEGGALNNKAKCSTCSI